VWLRDNARDAATRSPAHGQKLITLADIPAATRVTEAVWAEGELRLTFAPDGRQIRFDPDWLAAHAYDGWTFRAPGWTGDHIIRWDAASGGELGSVETYDAVRADAEARRRWLAAVRRYGLARLSGAPTEPGVATAVAELFGYVRETNYGRAFEVRARVNPENLAYTNLGLQAHTDNPYRDPPPGLQILACLRNTVEGGASVVVDGFMVAELLRARDPDGFALLSRYCARFEYAGSPEVRLRSKRPLIELGADGELLAVRFNNRSSAAFTDVAYDHMAAYYEAYRRMAELIDDPALHVRFQLAPGDLFIVDNLRVLLSTLAALEEA
jgi:gamma-butyrobetaine dioxygenase